MIDFHSHFLPKLDDGAENIEISLKMLADSTAAGIDTQVSTSHCYLNNGNDSILHFLEHRKASYSALCKAMAKSPDTYPKILLGSEVHYASGISKCPDLRSLCIENTDYLLLELPFSKWKPDMYDEIYHIMRLGIKPIIAHLDRYMAMESKFSELFSLDILFQINAEAFLDRSLRRKLLKLFEKDGVHAIGSDMHNISSRPQNLNLAYDIIEKKFGTEYTDYLKKSCEYIVNNETVPSPHLPKLTAMQKILL